MRFRHSRRRSAAEQVARVREAIMTALMRVGDEASVMALLPYLRSQDAAQRAREHRGAAGPAGSDPAVHGVAARRTAIPTCGCWRPNWRATCRRRTPPGCCAACCEHEQHPNVCAAAIDVLAEVGTREARARAAGLRRTLRRNAVSAIRRVDRHRPDFGHGRLGPEWQRSEAHGARAVHVTQEDVRRLCEFLYRRTGMLFDDNKRYYIDRRLAERIAATGSASFQSYFAMLRSDADHEIEHLVNAFTVNETYFYREEHQLRCMTSDLLGDVIRGRQPGEAIRIWSIPCSTGEEPYSIAIWLMENWSQVDSYNIEIVGSDIDTRALKAAAERRLRRTRPHAAVAGRDQPLFPAGRGWRISDRSRACGIRSSSPAPT